MADDSMQEKTEEATPKRRQDARDEGQVPRSQELTTALVLVGAAVILKALGPTLALSLSGTFQYGILMAGMGPLDAASAIILVQGIGWKTLAAVASLLLSISGVALTVTAMQARGVLSVKPLGPNWKRLDPLENGKRMLGKQPWVELFKSLGKLTIVGIAVNASLSAAWPDMVALAQQSPSGLIEVIRRYSHKLLMTAGLSYLALATVDYLYQLWQHEDNLRMSKEDVKQEAKQSDGDPMVKARRRSMGRAMARRQMFKDVPTADVVITNPTHIAIALKYDPTKADAPVVIAMGQRKVAERIKAIAREAGVPMVENKPLARALLASARVGTTIPQDLYMAVAEVLAFVIRSRSTRGSWEGSATA